MTDRRTRAAHRVAIWLSALMLLAACSMARTGVLLAEAWYPERNAAGDPLMAVFESRFPCLDEEARSIADCQRVKVALAIYRDAGTGAPTSYLMSRVYVGDERSDDRRLSAGALTLTEGAPFDYRAQVYRLDSGAPPEFRSFWRVSDDILFLLTSDGRPRVGDAGHSYALNRVAGTKGSL